MYKDMHRSSTDTRAVQAHSCGEPATKHTHTHTRIPVFMVHINKFSNTNKQVCVRAGNIQTATGHLMQVRSKKYNGHMHTHLESYTQNKHQHQGTETAMATSSAMMEDLQQAPADSNNATAGEADQLLCRVS